MKKLLLVILISFLIFSCAEKNKKEEISQDSNKTEDTLTWYQNAKFGMFIHWGLFSKLAGVYEGERYYGISEWIMKRAHIPVKEYEKTALSLNPVKFNAEEWVLQAKNAGMRYIIITAKHHDGFAMYHSNVSTFNIYDATPFKRDPLRELADACKKHEMKLGFYYSQTQDWHEPDAVGNDWDFNPGKIKFDYYLENKVKPQLKELLTNYGDLGIIWFDTPINIIKEESQELLDWVHNLQPECLVSSRIGNGLGDYIALGDHQLPDSLITRKPFEALFTHNDSWGYSNFDKNFRGPKEILRLLIETNSKGGNLLLNIGPEPDGTFPVESTLMLKSVGDWIEKNYEAVYGSTYSPFPDLSWGYCAAAEGIYYFHVFDWPSDGQLRIPDLAKEVTSIQLLENGKSLSYNIDNRDLLVDIPDLMPDPLCTVIKVEYSGKPEISEIRTLMEGYPALLKAQSGKFSGNAIYNNISWMEEFGNWKHAVVAMDWVYPDDSIVWTFTVKTPASYRIVLDYSYSGEKGGTQGIIKVADQELYFETMETGNKIYHFFDDQVGVVHFDTPGIQKLMIQPLHENQGKDFIVLRSVKLFPVI